MYNGPFVECHIEGWRRSWDVTMPNSGFYYTDDGNRVYPDKLLYLNVRPDAGTLMNCAVFVLGKDDLVAMNGREWIYDGVVVTSHLRGARIEGGDALMYRGKAEHIVESTARTPDVAVRRSYLRMLENVLDGLAPTVQADYRVTTDPVPMHLAIDDSLDPERPDPWEAAGHSYRPDVPPDRNMG